MNQPETTDPQAEYTHLGAYFKSLREHYELDAAQVAARLHIRPKYIEAIEAGDMSALPGKVYTQGYIQSYAEFLGLDAADVVRQYEGLAQISTAAKFRVIEPTKQQGIPAWRWIVAIALLLVLAYAMVQWLGSSAHPPIQSSIAPLPERLIEKTRAPLIITPQNKACLQMTRHHSAWPCYYLAPQTPPLRSIMELAQ